MESVKAFALRRDLVAEYDEEYLEMKLGELRTRLEVLARANIGPQSEIKEIQNNLNLMKSVGDIRARRNIYQLSYRRYILICPNDELLGIVLELRSRVYSLNKSNQEIWSARKLEAIELSIRNQEAGSQLRIEIETLAKAIDEGKFRLRRDDDLMRHFVGFAMRSNLILFFVLLGILGIFAILKVDIHSQWRKLPLLLFGACGGILSATLQYRRERIYPHDLRIEPIQLYFRAVLGAFAAAIVTLFLQLRIVDFPVLHVGAEDATSLSPAAQYIVAFASGFTERIFFRATDRVSTKRSEGEAQVQPTTGRAGTKSSSALR